MNSPEAGWVAVALLGKTRGIRGEITALALSSKPERFQTLQEVHLFGSGELLAGKRYAELREDCSEQNMRASLRAYSEPYLRGVLTLTATVTTMAYCLWAFQRAPHAGLSWYEVTIVPFVLWLLRYGLLLDQGAGQAPEELVLHDGFLLAMSAAWLVVFMCGVYVGS